MRRRDFFASAAVGAAAVIGWAPMVHARPKAPETVDAELLTLHATTKGKTIDPRLGRQPAMAQPPFKAYTNYRLIKRSGAVLAKGMAWKTQLPNDRDLMISLKDVIVPKRKSKDPMKFVIAASIAKRGATVFEPVLEVETITGEHVLIPADKHQGGLIVVSVKLLAKA